MKKNFKVFSLVLALLLAVGSLAACTSPTPAPSTAPANTTTASADASKAPEATPTPEAVKLTVGMPNVGREENPPGSGEYPDDNWATRFIVENFAKPNNIDLKFQLIDDTNDSFDQNYLLLMASQKAPDLAYVSDSICLNLANNEALADYQASLDKYGANLKKYLGDDFIKNRGTFNGMFDKLYTIPGKEDIPAISHYWIRKDWCDTLGLKIPTNFDEWYSTMKAFKERAGELEKAGRVKKAADVIPYAMYHTNYFTDWERIVVTNYPVKYFGPKNLDYYVYSGYGLEYMKEGFKEGFQFMNQMYKDGLISPNFALDSEQTEFDRAIVAGNAGSYCNNLFDGWQPNDPNGKHNLLKQNIPGAEFVYCDCFTNKYDGMKRNPLDYDVLTHIVTPYFSKAVDQAIMYLDRKSVV
jgi:putative aldouronate transport system substrate-binding protein